MKLCQVTMLDTSRFHLPVSIERKRGGGRGERYTLCNLIIHDLTQDNAHAITLDI